MAIVEALNTWLVLMYLEARVMPVHPERATTAVAKTLVDFLRHRYGVPCRHAHALVRLRVRPFERVRSSWCS